MRILVNTFSFKHSFIFQTVKFTFTVVLLFSPLIFMSSQSETLVFKQQRGNLSAFRDSFLDVNIMPLFLVNCTEDRKLRTKQYPQSLSFLYLFHKYCSQYTEVLSTLSQRKNVLIQLQIFN